MVPRLDRQICRASKGDSGLAKSIALPSIKGWTYEGETRLHNQTVNLWRYTARHLVKQVDYRFYVSLDDAPVRLWMHGNDALSGAHFDEWIVDYQRYVPGRPDKSLFDKPTICEGAQAAADDEPIHGAAVRASMMLPHVSYRGGNAEYDAFLSSEHGSSRRHHSVEDYHHRAAIHSRNAKMIAEHNARENKTFTMAMNKFGDWHEDEFLAAILPKAHRRKMRALHQAACDGGAACLDEADGARSRQVVRHQLEYEPAVSDFSRLPKDVSWRGSGADVRYVKDQASCGSCWAFSAVGAMEAAWFMATGERVSLSEQEIIDCTWGTAGRGHDSANAGCDGGDSWTAVSYAVSVGGLAALRDYQYKGLDGYCRRDGTARAAGFRGWVGVPSLNESALMEAVYSRGPISVAMDASHESFRFYSSGVYAEPECEYKAGQLDHAVMLVGYGTSETEGDYWLVRNSWSDHWGDAGYIKVSRDNHGCGVPADAVYAVADPTALTA